MLDTHAWIWWADESERLSIGARESIAEAGAIGISAISCWELAMLENKGRLRFAGGSRSWIRAAVARPGITALPLDPQTAIDAAYLSQDDGFPDDPADRFIYATARNHGAPLVTADRTIRDYDPRATVW